MPAGIRTSDVAKNWPMILIVIAILLVFIGIILDSSGV